MISSWTSSGARLTFSDTGSGLPVLFLHPTPLDHDYWRLLSAHLPGVRAIAVDLRGHGASELGSRLPVGGFSLVPDAPVLTMAQLAEDILALLDHLKLTQAVFVGCSIGGYVLLELWRKAPGRARGLNFICSKPQPDAEPNRLKRAANIAQARSGGNQALMDGFAQSLVGATSRSHYPEIVSELRSRMTVTPEAEVAVQAGLAIRPDSVPDLSTITVPVLAIAGGEDTAVAPADMESFKVVPGGCQFHLLPDAGHFAACEQPQKVAAILADWLNQFAFHT
jgi:pimeloyl-ACP methyl ester carboxylesterase